MVKHMRKDEIKKVLSIVLISLSLLGGVGGITISLINVSIVLEPQKGNDKHSDASNISNVVEENDTTRQDEEMKIYNNSVEIQVRCVSVFALDTNQQYIPVSYAPINLEDNTCCSLISESKKYYADIKEGVYLFCNVVPGEYDIVFEGGEDFANSKKQISVSEDSQIEFIMDTKYQNDVCYEEYKITYECCAEQYYMFMDDNGKNKIVDGTFKTDENGTFYFVVAWDLSHDTHIHFVNGGHANIHIDEIYNGGTFIN